MWVFVYFHGCISDIVHSRCSPWLVKKHMSKPHIITASFTCFYMCFHSNCLVVFSLFLSCSHVKAYLWAAASSLFAKVLRLLWHSEYASALAARLKFCLRRGCVGEKLCVKGSKFWSVEKLCVVATSRRVSRMISVWSITSYWAPLLWNPEKRLFLLQMLKQKNWILKSHTGNTHTHTPLKHFEKTWKS